jgi:hypothetical protein
MPVQGIHVYMSGARRLTLLVYRVRDTWSMPKRKILALHSRFLKGRAITGALGADVSKNVETDASVPHD